MNSTSKAKSKNYVLDKRSEEAENADVFNNLPFPGDLMASNANLDALIPRDDFDIEESATSQSEPPRTVQIRDLEGDAFFYSTLRKPDFQRETASWSPRKIADFVKTFVDGDLIPAVILWRLQGSNFIIDGAHQLSALIAWVNDDYGDGIISQMVVRANLKTHRPRIHTAIPRTNTRLLAPKVRFYTWP